MTAVPQQVDVALVGAGLGSLSCAVELARQGLKVCVLEQHRVAGGYAHAFKRRGYLFDVSLHHIGGLNPGCMTHGMLHSLGVLEKLRPYRRENIFHAELPGLSVVLPNDREGVIDELSKLFPAERDGLVALFLFLDRLKADVIGPTMDPDFRVPLAERVSSAYLDHTFGDLLRAYLSDARLMAVLGQLWMYIGLPPNRAAATFAACVFCSSFLEGAHHVRGGGQAVSAAFVERLKELGGECLTRSPVTRVIVEEGKAAGVEIADGTRIAARAVVSGVNPFATFFDLVPEAAISRVFRYRIGQMEPSISLYSHYIGLDCRPGEIGMEHDNFFLNHGFDLDEAYRRALDGEIDSTDWCLTSYERSDPDVAPEGCGIISVAEVTPAADWIDIDEETYARRKREVRDRLLRKALRRFPDLEQHIAVEELATPRTMHRFTSNHAGAIYGLAQTVQQAHSRRLRNRTPIGGLFLTGAWTWSGGGYEGSVMTGVQTAAVVLDHLDAPRPAPPVRLHPPATLPPRNDVDVETTGIASPSANGWEAGGGAGAGGEAGGGAGKGKGAGEGAPRDRVQARVFGYDLGVQGVATPQAYLRYMDRGRVELIESLCSGAGEESWLTRYTINIYRLDVVFTSISAFGDVLEVHTGLRRASSHRAAFDQRIVKTDTRELVSDGVVEVLFLDERGQLAPVPGSLASELETGRKRPRPPLRFPPGGKEERYPYTARFRVYFEDTDTQGIAYHATYAKFSEAALEETLLAMRPAEKRGSWLDPDHVHVSRLSMRFLRSARLGDRLVVQTRGRQTSPGEVLIEQQIILVEHEQVAAQVVMEVGFVDQEGKHQAMPEALRGLLPSMGE